MKILILRTGNSCRSQMAHGFLYSFDARLQVFSAGTAPAARVNPQAVATMADVGIDIGSHTPCNVAKYLGETRDDVITVCGGANESCPAFMGRYGIESIYQIHPMRREHPILLPESFAACGMKIGEHYLNITQNLL